MDVEVITLSDLSKPAAAADVPWRGDNDFCNRFALLLLQSSTPQIERIPEFQANSFFTDDHCAFSVDSFYQIWYFPTPQQ
jgi:hypothetical protein